MPEQSTKYALNPFYTLYTPYTVYIYPPYIQRECTPLHYAAANNHLMAVVLVLEAGGQADVTDKV